MVSCITSPTWPLLEATIKQNTNIGKEPLKKKFSQRKNNILA